MSLVRDCNRTGKNSIEIKLVICLIISYQSRRLSHKDASDCSSESKYEEFSEEKVRDIKRTEFIKSENSDWSYV